MKNIKINIIIVVIVLIIVILGSTYALFLLNDGSFLGVNRSAKLDFFIETKRVVPNDTDFNATSQVIVPFKVNELANAIINNGCVDIYDNVVCEVFETKLVNRGNAGFDLTGDIMFSGIEEMPNLRWDVIHSNSILDNYSRIGTNFNDISLNASVNDTYGKFVDEFYLDRVSGTLPNTIYFYTVIWINETENSIQGDNGTFRATLKFVDHNGDGLTSTFVG